LPDNIVTIDFRRHLRLEPGDWLLDLGSGNGRHTIEACRWPCRVVSVDVDPDELRKARYFLRAPRGASPYQRFVRQEREGVPGWADFVVADAQHLPFRDGAFDKVMCTEVLEHIPDDKEGISELYRVAKPGSDVAVSVPHYWPERAFWTLSWEYWHTPGGHVRTYRPGEMARYLREQGFELRATRYRHAFQSVYWFLRCTFGKNNEERLLPSSMFRFINWYHEARSPLLERVEALANLIIGKDMVLYSRKLADASIEKGPGEAGAASLREHTRTGAHGAGGP
jgi:ubiquinone/menaquinone biosynthesis C-methylase UbiE